MSCSFVWHPVKEGIPISSFTPSNTADVLKRAFGNFPITLGKSNIPVLEGIKAAQGERDDDFWQNLIDAIYKCEDIYLEMVC